MWAGRGVNGLLKTFTDPCRGGGGGRPVSLHRKCGIRAQGVLTGILQGERRINEV